MKSKEDVQELLEQNSDIPRLLLLPWCTAPKDYCKIANYDCGECNSSSCNNVHPTA